MRTPADLAGSDPVVVPPSEATPALSLLEAEKRHIESILRRIAELTQMKFFSSEIAQVENGDFVLIDYVNDQCHMLSQSADPRMGVPDPVIAAIARTLVESSAEMIRGKRV